MPEVGLECRVSLPALARANPQACRSIWGWALILSLAAPQAFVINLAKFDGVIGDPRSDTNTNGDWPSTSRLQSTQGPQLPAG